MSGVDVLELLRKIAAGEGDVELMAMRCHGALSEFIEAAKVLDNKAMQRTKLTASVYTSHVMRLRAALAAVSPK